MPASFRRAQKGSNFGSYLVSQSGVYALDRFGIKTLVIVAEAGSQAERLYQAAGFEIVEHQIGIGRWQESA